MVKDDEKTEAYAASSPSNGDKDDDEDVGLHSTAGHVNVVTPAVISNAAPPTQQQPQNFDVNALLADFGIDPYLVPPVPAPQQSQAASRPMWLAFRNS